MSCRVPTLSLQFGELLGQNVLTLLQLPLLLLHVLHVVSQRLDLGLVLHTQRRQTQTPVMVAREERDSWIWTNVWLISDEKSLFTCEMSS